MNEEEVELHATAFILGVLLNGLCCEKGLKICNRGSPPVVYQNIALLSIAKANFKSQSGFSLSELPDSSILFFNLLQQ